jgi:signal transduction histidine kinase
MPHVSRRVAVLLGIACTALVAIGDHITGLDVAFTLLYIVPIAFVAWYAGFRHGALVATLATGASAAAALYERDSFLVTVWNELGVLVLFLVLAYLLDRYRVLIAQERRQHQSTVDQLRHADRLNVIGTLAAGVAHEIGTPLNVISGSAELITQTRDAAEIEEMSKIIREQTGKISAIIRHLLDFGHRGGTSSTTLDLNDLARSTTILLVSIARKRSVEVVLEPASTPIFVYGNLAELEQVLSNLILNGIQAMSKRGTVTVRVGLASRPNGEGDGQFGTITVEDDGPGIPSDALPHIFEPFFTTKGVGEGTGLGLSVSYGIVRDHRGLIEVDSAPGRGARFTMLLPLGNQDAHRATQAPSTSLPPT